MAKKLIIKSFPNIKKAGQRNFNLKPLTRKANLNISDELSTWAKGKSFCLFTSGCQANVRDSEIIVAYLTRLGLNQITDPYKADLVLFNTCAIRENAEKKIYGEIGQLKQSAKDNPNKIIGICGCMAQEEKPMRFIKEHFPYVNLVFGTHNIDSIYSLLDSCIKDEARIFDVTSNQGEVVENLPSSRFDKTKAFVNIMYGCDNFCTYCIVPYTRGRMRSRSIDEILKEVNDLISLGYKEVTLIGQNVNAYGYDLKDPNSSFDKLLEAVAQTNIPRIRFTTSHPAYFKEEVFQVMAKYSNIMPSLHLPLQSGSDTILKRMNRHYDKKQYLDLVDLLRKYIPDVYLTTDIIVGFPNESDCDFEDTLDVVRKVNYDNAYTFIFSPREGTPAYYMEDKITPKEKSIRFDKLKQLIDQQATISASKQVNQIVEVLFDTVSKKDKTMISGYSRHNRLVHVKGDESLIGQIRKVKIIESRTYSLIGELLDD